MLAEALHGLLDSYRRGLAQMGAHVHAWSPDVVDQRLRELLEARCDLVELLRVRSFLHHRRSGVLAARRNDLESSRREFQRAAELLRILSRSASGAICESLYCASLSYLYYRCGQHERSRELVHRALAIDTELESEIGSGALYGHRIQLVRNLVRIEARFTTSESATKLGLGLLEQLEGAPGAAPTPHRWQQSDPQTLPCALRRALANQIVLELAIIHLKSATRSADNRRYAEHVGRCRARHEDLAAEAHAWLAFAIAIETPDLLDAVESSTRYLQGGPGDSPWLWYCVLIQCVERLARAEASEAKAAASTILHDRTSWKLAPSVVRGFPVAGAS